MCWVKKSGDTETSTRRSEVGQRLNNDSSYRRNILIGKCGNDGYQADNPDSTTAYRCSKTIRCRSLMSSCRYIVTWVHLREDADRSNYRPATRLSNLEIVFLPPNATSRHVSCRVYVRVRVCVRACECVCVTSIQIRLHLMYKFV